MGLELWPVVPPRVIGPFCTLSRLGMAEFVLESELPSLLRDVPVCAEAAIVPASRLAAAIAINLLVIVILSVVPSYPVLTELAAERGGNGRPAIEFRADAAAL
jgi:hypothetical protein